MRAPRASRYVVMSVPGREDDGSDTWWFVLDRRMRKSVRIGAGDVMIARAAARCRELNAKSKKPRKR